MQVHIATGDECQVAACANAAALTVDVFSSIDSDLGTADITTGVIERPGIESDGAASNNRARVIQRFFDEKINALATLIVLVVSKLLLLRLAKGEGTKS